MVDVQFVLVGSSGSGKSAFVNAVRGIDKEDKGASPVNIVEIEEEPHDYIDSINPRVSYHDLPGYGTTNYSQLELYWTKFNLEKFDRFLIFTSLRITNLDAEMIKKVKSAKKSFLIIRTKIDSDYVLEKNKKQFDNEKFLKEIRDYISKEMKLSSPENIFLISNYEPHNWDFFRLIAALEVLPVHGMDVWREFFLNNNIKTADPFQDDGIESAQRLIKKLDEWKEVKINVGVVGKSGSGKSTLINRIRGIEDTDELFGAETGVTETTTIPAQYTDPNNPNIIYWDCPGIGSRVLPNVDTYCEKVGIEKFDVFIIVNTERFEPIIGSLAKKLKSTKKPFLFARAKIDNDLENARRKSAFDEVKELETIKRYCADKLNAAEAKTDDKDIFLIDNHKPEKWDFTRLKTAIEDGFPSIVRKSFLLFILTYFEEGLKRKIKEFKGQIWSETLLLTYNVGALVQRSLNYYSSLIIRKTEFFRSQLGFPEKDSEQFQEMSPAHKEAIKKFYFEPDSDVESWLRSFNADCEDLLAHVNKAPYKFVFCILQIILDEMEKIALKILKEGLDPKAMD
ncbi:interferon-inducible GTPase 1-like [Dendronephthya gigantea]|uniref:interferon-inducible GTPase 1-like n=1 Tax=Dendronephthya gigantea TaxID=151771 RepID=UPI00106AC510|nr:interferon-inducible GTPase 1-like [Dendronephthya gigantea]